MADRSALVALLQRVEPLRTMQVWARYLVTTGLVLVCFEIRWLVYDIYPYPYLIFLPAVVGASFIFNRGSGFLATFLSGALTLYFFNEPRGSFAVETFGTGIVPDERIKQAVLEVFDLRPAAIIRDLDLLRSIYRTTSAYGHFGRPQGSNILLDNEDPAKRTAVGPTFTWEATDRAEALKSSASN